MKKICLIIYLLGFLVAQAQYQSYFDSFKNSTSLQDATIGFSVIDINTGAKIYSYNDAAYMYPASLQKTITTATALQLLGGNFTYKTPIQYSGNISNGVLNGNVYIQGVGDPTLNSKSISNDFYLKLINLLKSKGISKIEGQVIVETDEPYCVPSWLYEDIGNYYGAAAQLFNYKDNYYTLHLQQKADGQKPVISKIENAVPYTFNITATCSDTKRGDNSYIMGAPFSIERQLIGTISAGSGIFKVKGANSFPNYTFLSDLKQNGVFKELNNQSVSLERKDLGFIESPLLKDIVKITNFESNNLFAEAILNTLGLEFRDKFDTQNGIAVVEDFLNQLQIPNKKIEIKDGCGLSRTNAISAKTEAEFLCDVYTNKDFVNSLPKAGEEGTLIYLKDERIKGKVQAKSGSADGVINYAGYIYTNNGKVYSFCLMLNYAYKSKIEIRREIATLLAGFI